MTLTAKNLVVATSAASSTPQATIVREGAGSPIRIVVEGVPPTAGPQSLLQDFFLSPGFATLVVGTIAAIIALRQASIALRSLRHTQERGANDRWWDTLTWVYDRVTLDSSEKKALSRRVALSLFHQLADSAEKLHQNSIALAPRKVGREAQGGAKTDDDTGEEAPDSPRAASDATADDAPISIAAHAYSDLEIKKVLIAGLVAEFEDGESTSYLRAADPRDGASKTSGNAYDTTGSAGLTGASYGLSGVVASINSRAKYRSSDPVADELEDSLREKLDPSGLSSRRVIREAREAYERRVHDALERSVMSIGPAVSLVDFQQANPRPALSGAPGMLDVDFYVRHQDGRVLLVEAIRGRDMRSVSRRVKALDEAMKPFDKRKTRALFVASLEMVGNAEREMSVPVLIWNPRDGAAPVVDAVRGIFETEW